MTSPGDKSERRGTGRTVVQDRATRVIQAILRDPIEAQRLLELDLDQGEAPAGVLAVLDTAESLSRIRGLNLFGKIEGIRDRITRQVRGH
jgi:hypothetical protein